MQRYNFGATFVALMLMGLLIGCRGAEGSADATTQPTAAVVAAQPTKPPPIVVVSTRAASGEPAAQPTVSPSDGAAEPALPTALPTAAVTAAPPTEAPTATPTVAPTALPPPATAVPPTAVPPTAAPPTATAVPPTAAPQGANGLIASHFALQDRANLTVNGEIWFEFHVANLTSSDVPFGALGVMPKKDGTDRPQWYQHSYGGNNDVIPPGGLSWDDHIQLPEAGNYTLRLVVCFQELGACRNTPGAWQTLSPEIPITVR